MMQELLFGSWGLQLLAYCQQYPWQMVAVVLVAAHLLFDLLSPNTLSSGADLGAGDFGGADCGDAGGCGD